MRKFLPLLIILLIGIRCDQPDKQQKIQSVTGLVTEKAMVVSARKEASEIGKTIMQQGGNAFDAMVATELALAVVYPVAGNIGGGGFMVYRKSNGETGALDYREKAPKSARKNMYQDENGEIISGMSTLGALAIGIPGTIAGIFEVHKEFGTLPMEALIQPAIDLAERGIVITEKQAKTLNSRRSGFQKANNYKILLDKTWEAGDVLQLKELAATLRRIQVNGRDEFYKGQTAALMVNYLEELGGIITMDDLAVYNAVWRTPVNFEYKNHTITSMTLPSSGGVLLEQMLRTLEDYDVESLGHNTKKYMQLLTEVERRSYADRAQFLGDSDFINVQADALTNKSYLRSRMKDFSWNNANSSSNIQHGNPYNVESEETTHFSIIDQFGNAVAVTTTLNTAYGSKVYVKGGGFFLNNEMDDFSIKPGFPNNYGLVGSEANAIAPEKRMLSSMTPTIVAKNDSLMMVVGSPGGSTIITSVLQNILNVVEFKMGMQQSVNTPRFHHQWLPDYIRIEPTGFDNQLIESMQALGYNFNKPENRSYIGRVDGILVVGGKLEAGADPRGDDAAAGF